MEGGKIMAGVQRGDRVICLKSEWILAAPRAAAGLLARLREEGVSLYCVDLQEDLACDRERKLVVSTGAARLVQKLLDSLCACEKQSEDRPEAPPRVLLPEKEEEPPGKRFAGGPVPFGWRVDDAGWLEVDEDQQTIIRAMERMRAERVSYRAMTRRVLKEYGLKLSSEGIRKILKRQHGSSKRGNRPPDRQTTRQPDEM